MTAAIQTTVLDTLKSAQDSADGSLYTKDSLASTATLANVASSGSSVTLLAANAARLGAMVFNDSTSVLYLKMGVTASTSSYTVQIASNGYYELPAGHVYTGRIDGIWSSANGNARLTELSA